MKIHRDIVILLSVTFSMSYTICECNAFTVMKLFIVTSTHYDVFIYLFHMVCNE